MFYCVVLHCAVLSLLYCVVLCCTLLYCDDMCFNVLHCVLLYCNVLNVLSFVYVVLYRKIPNISTGLKEVRKHLLGGLY